MRCRWLGRVIVVAAGIVGGVAGFAPGGQSARDEEPRAGLPTPQQLLQELPRELTSAIPGDVDVELKEKLEKAKEFAEVQELFDIVSWRTFVAVNWPVNNKGQPDGNINGPGRKLWDTYKTDDEVFLPDGGKPAPWGEVRQNKRFAALNIKPGARVLRSISAVNGNLAHDQHKVPVNDVIQAFTYPIWDQNGTMVRYEIYMNKDEFDLIVADELYNLEGQAAFWQKGKPLVFPVNDPHDQDKVGAIELKLAWKVLDESKGDLPGRFLTVQGTIFTGPDGTVVKNVTLGLVGMHIGHKTRSSPQWIWSTFGHVDNIRTNALEKFNGKPIKPLFTNPNQEYLVVNTPSQTAPPYRDGQTPTQVLQLTPIPPATQEVNRAAQAALRAKKSVLRFYELLNTQWPTDPSAKPTPPGSYPDSVTNKPGGRPTPVYLVNPLMETYFQLGNQPMVNQEEGGNPSDKKQVFGTESCMGCHSSAAIATSVTVDPQGKKTANFGPQLSADFSWLLQQRAHFKSGQ